jgi:uncharacterized protein (TIGR00730 family)
MSKTATIFGGGQKAITVEYAAAQKIARELAKKNYTIKSGGYSGIMEAASRGSVEEGGEAIGVTCATFPSTKGNEYLTTTVVANDIFDRLRVLMDSDLFIIMKGGIGTLSEFFLLWDIIRKQKNSPKIILVGDHWERIINSLKISGLISSKEENLLEICEGVKKVVSLL